MKLLPKAAALLTLGILPGIALSQTAATDNPSGPYVGAGWGQFNLNVDHFDQVDDAFEEVFDADDNAWKVFGGWRFNPYVAVELDYIDFGGPEDEVRSSGSSGDYRVELSGLAPYLVGTLPLGPVELFGKLGYYYYDVDLGLDLDDADFDSSHSGNDFAYGVGVGFTVLERLYLRAEYEKVDLDFADDADAFWLSAAWRF